MKKKNILALFVSFVFLAVSLGAFGDTAIEKFLKGTLKKNPPYNVGLSNGLITHSWRTQMVNDMEKEFQLYKGMGLVNKLIVQHAGFEVELQISQIRNLINSNVDLIIINPNSQSALNPVLEEANAKGILCIIFDQRTTSPDALQVYPNNYDWMADQTEYVIKRMNGSGSLYYLSGYDGSPANTDRDKAFYDTAKKYAGIKVLGKANGNWDPTTSQQVMANVLAAVPQMDGLVTQDGESLGAIRAFEAAGQGPAGHERGRPPALPRVLAEEPAFGLQGLRHRKRPRLHHQPRPWDRRQAPPGQADEARLLQAGCRHARHHEYHHGRAVEELHHGRQRQKAVRRASGRQRHPGIHRQLVFPGPDQRLVQVEPFSRMNGRHASACRPLARGGTDEPA